MPNIIRLGDPTSHGGKVISFAASDFIVDGLAIACVDDLCSCPLPGHGVSQIVEGDPDKEKQLHTRATRPDAAPN